jgi:hypothetical protein
VPKYHAMKAYGENVDKGPRILYLECVLNSRSGRLSTPRESIIYRLHIINEVYVIDLINTFELCTEELYVGNLTRHDNNLGKNRTRDAEKTREGRRLLTPGRQSGYKCEA